MKKTQSEIKYFYREEVDEEDGKFRHLTIAYIYDFITSTVKYGASMFRKDRENEPFIKSKHRETALGRLLKRPVSLEYKSEHYWEIENHIRDSIRTEGVKGKRID